MQKAKEKSCHIKRSLYISVTALLIAFVSILSAIVLANTPDTEIEYDSRVADPDTSTPSEMGFSDIPWLHDGRIWTDKSVLANTEPGANDFTVTLSALSQSYPLYDGYIVPTDTVFIVDMSGSMYQESIDGRPRVAALVDALNEAIEILLNANARNRIAVVAYGGRTGGYSRAQDVLPLGRPERSPGATAFFSYRQSGAEHYVDVNTIVKLTASILVQGSTPTQRGVYNGANILTAADDLTIPALDSSGNPFTGLGNTPLLLTRKPNLVLMTDGEPTMAWSDYLFTIAPSDTNQTYGDGSYGETGVSLLTVLTSAHRKRLVYNHYYSNNALHTPDVVNYGTPNQSVGFYTISLNDVPPPLLISATMFPFNPSDTLAAGYADIAVPDEQNVGTIGGTYPSTAPNVAMGAVLRDFTASPSVLFWAQFRVAFANYHWEELTINNSEGLTLDELAFADEFFPANDLQALRDAFTSIATEIQKQSFSAVTDSAGGQVEYDGYLVFSDVLGEYMEFSEITGFEFDGVSFDRSGLGQSIINNTDGVKTRYEDILYHHINYGNMPGDTGHNPVRYVSKEQVSILIESNITSGNLASNNSIKYYAYSNRDFADSFFTVNGTESVRPAGAAAVVDVYPMFGNLAAPVFTGGATDLMYITFHVVTALENNTVFEEVFSTDSDGYPLNRRLNKDEQLIRLYIPAILIPQRTVDPETGGLSGNQLPVRVHYKVALNEALFRAGVSEDYISNNKRGDDVFFFTNRHPENVSLAFYQPHQFNPYYQPGRPGYNERGVIKTSNITGTSSHVSLHRHASRPGEGRTEIQWLGNNGRLTIHQSNIPPEQPEPPIPPIPPNEKSPQTGTYYNTALSLSIALVSLGLIACSIILIRNDYISRKDNDRSKRS